jgi:hypothetical protein
MSGPVQIPPTCKPTFIETLQKAAYNQLNTYITIQTNLWGVDCCLYNPVFTTSIYDDEDTLFNYNAVEDFHARILIQGLQGTRFSGRDQWTHENFPLLWWNQPNIFDIKQDAKIIVNHAARQLAFRSLYVRRIVNQFLELVQIHHLVPLQ